MKELFERMHRSDRQLDLVMTGTVLAYGIYMIFMIGNAFVTQPIIHAVITK